MERKWMERKWNTNGTQMERKRKDIPNWFQIEGPITFHMTYVLKNNVGLQRVAVIILSNLSHYLSKKQIANRAANQNIFGRLKNLSGVIFFSERPQKIVYASRNKCLDVTKKMDVQKFLRFQILVTKISKIGL